MLNSFVALGRLSSVVCSSIRTALLNCLVLALLLLPPLAVPPAAHADGLDVVDVRTDNYPRVIVRFTATAEDGSPLNLLQPGQVKVQENGVEQDQVDFYSLREVSPELWVVLVVDVSGSMNDDDKIKRARESARAFVARLRPKDRTTIVTFSDRVVLHQQATGDTAVLGKAIDSLQAKGPTRMNDGLARGVAEALRAREGARRAIILLSDGEDTDSQVDLEAAMAPAVEAKVPIYTIGLGSDVKGDVLSSIASKTRARYYPVPRPADLEYVFKLLSGQFASQYEAWWSSSSILPAGSNVDGRLSVLLPGQAGLEQSFRYATPVMIRQRSQVVEAYAGGGELRPVELTEARAWQLPDWWPIMAAVFAALGAFGGYYGLVLRLTRSRQQERLGRFVHSRIEATTGLASLRSAPTGQSMRSAVLGLARFSQRLTPTRVLDDMRHRMVLAGRPSGWQFSQFLAAKILLTAVLGVVGYVLGAATSKDPARILLMTGALTGLGYYLPTMWLGARIRNRQKAIARALPDALDLLTVGVSAGLAFDGAVMEVVQKADSNNELAHELANFLAELQMGRGRREALQGLDRRTEVEDVKILVASLIQAEELGMTLSETLTVQADQMRLRRSQRAEELAHKATLKMMFPMIMLIFPALFIVIMGPALPGIMSYMKGAT